MTISNSDSAPAAALARLSEPLIELCTASAATVLPRISPRQLHVLLTVLAEEPITLGTLGRRLGASPSATSRRCDRLQAAGLLTRTGGPADRRTVFVGVTAEGRLLLHRIREKRHRDLRRVLDRMDDDRQHALLRGLLAFSAAAVAPSGAGGEKPA
ncbi:DNA-binding MarR family transcriptional regulator [Prauserella shujinwangii]|uniref:DNA-binding MarR family transcriptional regulator n=1 Tax=Prauserella shujinwangii TaxID=1453103 RepID=A0A2T0M011_9PSEU|nr:MarR family transcriptional regulator [Prauserella shujinwangii]PRX49921.1 DNA-binding MarR family transcriptional regulator [Prauserella shujinwangii]